MRVRLLGVLVGALLFSSAACDKADLPELPSLGDVKQAVTNSVETVKQTADAAGSIRLELDSPVVAAGCYGRLLLQGGGRPNVLSIASYNDPTNETFPSVLMHAKVAAADAAGLSAAPVEAIVLVQLAGDGEAWRSTDDRPAMLTLSVDGAGALSGQASGVLVNAETGAEKPLSAVLAGSFEVVGLK